MSQAVTLPSSTAGSLVDHPGARDHDDQGDKEQGAGDLLKDDEGQRHADEGCDRVISTFRYLSSFVAGLLSASSNDSANDCRLCWQRANFLPDTS